MIGWVDERTPPFTKNGNVGDGLRGGVGEVFRNRMAEELAWLAEERETKM